MKNKIILLTLVLSSTLLLPACVSNRLYKDSEKHRVALQREIADLKMDNENFKSRLKLMEDANESAANELEEKERALSENESQLADQQMRLQQLQALIDKQKSNTEALRAKIAKAMGNFSSDQLSVHTKNGKVYVSLSEKMLFPSGSADVNEEGKKALEQLAKALNENTDINVQIEGHTDSVPIKYKFVDNWALSVARSTAIVRILTNDYHVAAERVSASGRSQYEPVAANTTEEGRALNRRTEIILSPKLDELIRLIENNE